MPDWLKEELDLYNPMPEYFDGVYHGYDVENYEYTTRNEAFQKCYELMFEHYDKELHRLTMENIDANHELIKCQDRQKLKPIDENTPRETLILLRVFDSFLEGMVSANDEVHYTFLDQHYSCDLINAKGWTELPETETT